MRGIKVLILLLVVPMLSWSGDMTSADGKPFGRVTGKTRQPVTIVDSVQMSSGFGTLSFNLTTDGVRKTTNPSDSSFVFAFFTQRTVDTSATPNQYSYTVLKNGQRQVSGIRVVSSDANDSARVDVYVIVK